MGIISVESEIIEKLKEENLVKKIKEKIELAFNKDPNQNKVIKSISNYKDGSISPGNVEDIFGSNFSKITSKLEEIITVNKKNTFNKLKFVEKDKSLQSRYSRLYKAYENDLRELIDLNLNFYETLPGNKETLLFLRNGE